MTSVSRSSSELVAGVVLTVCPSLIKKDIEELFEEVGRPIVINRAVLDPDSLFGMYVFEYTAIWAVKLPQTNPTWDAIHGIACYMTTAEIPNFEHWAFVARGTFPGSGRVAYFVAQFGEGSYIPTNEEREKDRRSPLREKKYPFHADLVEINKRHAALCLCTTMATTTVWVYLKEYDTLGNPVFINKGNVLEDPNGTLISEGFDSSQWKQIEPLTVSQLNELMYRTTNVGRKYHPTENNCQCFAKSMFDLAI